MKTLYGAAIAALLAVPLPALAQDSGHHDGMSMPDAKGDQPPPAPDKPADKPDAKGDGMGAMGGMTGHAMTDHSMMDHTMMMGSTHSGHDGGAMQMGASGYADGSGTSRQPAASGAMHGLHLATGDWMVMLHGYAFANWTDQGGPRGDTEAFVASMAMVTAERHFAGGSRLQLRTMLSAEPLMGPRGYPNLFATGETAHGAALVDRQHPHDLFMELAARFDVPLGGELTGFVYGGPVGEPALGPPAFMHRASAPYLALAPIGHHWFDSTHISYGVVTTGIGSDHFQLEASAFRGREPDEHRWDIEAPALDSWSARATWTPTPHWAAQVSYGRLHRPEELHGDEDEGRFTASVQYARGGLNATLGYSVKNRIPGRALSAWLGEVNWDLDTHHGLFGRIENVANDELFPDDTDPLHDTKFRVTRFEAGYAYRMKLVGPLHLALGGSGAVYAKPGALNAAYGHAPVSGTLFAKLSIGH